MTPTPTCCFELSSHAPTWISLPRKERTRIPVIVSLFYHFYTLKYPNIQKTTVKQTRLKDLRAKSYQGSDEEWARIVSYVFGQVSTVGKPEWCHGIEVSASVSDPENDEDKELSLTIRKRIQTITVRSV